MNTTIQQIIHLDTYLHGFARRPDEDGELSFEGASSPEGKDDAVLVLNPLTGKCRLHWWSHDHEEHRDLGDTDAAIALASVFQGLFAKAKARVEDQHKIAAQYARDAAINAATRKVTGLDGPSP